MRNSAVRWAVVGGAVVLCVIGGMLVARALGPSNGDVRAAAESLVPPGGQIVERTARHDGNFPAPGPYVAAIGVVGLGGSPAQQAQRAEAAARAQGWHVVEWEDLAGAARLELRRDGLVGRMSVRKFEDLINVSVQRDGRANSTRRSIGMAVGALIGLAGAGAVLAIARR